MKVIHHYKINELVKEIGNIIVEVDISGTPVRVEARDLVFSDNIEEDAKRNPELEVLWENIASYIKWMLSDLELKIEEFSAYSKKYIKWYLKGKGEKDTIEGRNEAFFTVYGRDVEEKDMKLAAVFAFRGFCEEKRQPLSHEEWLNLLQFVEGMQFAEVRDFREFYDKMYKARLSGIFYDDLIRSLNELKEASETVSAIAEGFKQKGVLIATMLSGKKSKIYEKEKVLEEIIKKDEFMEDNL